MSFRWKITYLCTIGREKAGKKLVGKKELEKVGSHLHFLGQNMQPYLLPVTFRIVRESKRGGKTHSTQCKESTSSMYYNHMARKT